ncbi:MAG: Fic family protein [Rhodocyclaceae bacterium]|nr:Fic family protein [Rhodocyclaceae bacterium]MDZ4214326.1 Fic family protein [Rhodocyclaceae bacterium]
MGMTELDIPSPASLDVKVVWQALAEAHRHLAELKGLCEALPNRAILLDTLSIQEAKDSSEIENIITTHDELYAYDKSGPSSPAAKEVQNYIAALRVGSEEVAQSGLIRLNTILRVQEQVEQNNAGFRKLPGTVLKNQMSGEVVYEPPQDPTVIEKLMTDLVAFIHDDDGLDPLLRMAVAHHQFESIHPFYDGNGRTGRILNLLVLQREGLLDLPVLYLSRYITSTKPDYYRLLQTTRETHGGPRSWQDWCAYLLRGVALTARSEIRLIKQLRELMQATKQRLRGELPKLYSQELLNNLFRHPYTKIEFVERDLGVSRITAAKHLDVLVQHDFVEKQKIGRTNFYINRPLFKLLTSISLNDE